MSTPSVLTQLEGRIGHVTLDRPEVMNAIDLELAHGLEAAVRGLALEADVIVIRGAGGNFSVGGDVEAVERLRAAGRDALSTLFDAFGAACQAIAAVDPPVLAAVEGYALAGGFELMQACDLAIVRDDARIADHHATAGVIPGGGSTQRLPRLVGRQRALGLILTGDRLTGAEAAAWGLAYRSVRPQHFDTAVAELAERIAGANPDAQRRIKRLVREGLETPIRDGLARERREVVEHLTSTEEPAWKN